MAKFLDKAGLERFWAKTKAYVDEHGQPGDTTYLINAPLGAIVIWSGTADSVPQGWSICDGTNGTLDLRDKFVLGAGDVHEVGETGGSETVTLTVAQMPAHTHSTVIRGTGTDTNPGSSGKVQRFTSISASNETYTNLSHTSTSKGSGAAHNNMPPYYTALYIQKTGVTPTDYTTQDDVSTMIQNALAEIPKSGGGVPVGTITIWGSEDIPDGWALCDGQDGRPDLRDKFVLGSGESHTIGETGGEEEVALTVAQMPQHTHPASYAASGSSSTPVLGRSSAKIVGYDESVMGEMGDSQPHPNMPPYIVLCYIIKVSPDETDGVTEERVREIVQEAAGEAYSTEETRIGTWIDGKPLYRKTFHCTSPSNSNGGSSQISEVYVENWDVVRSYGFVMPETGFKHPLPAFWCSFYPSFSGDVLEYAFEENGPLRIRVSSSYSGTSLFNSRPVTLTVEYTKTTD